MVYQSRITRIMELIPEESITFHKLMCKTGIDYRTIRSNVEAIIRIQNAEKIVQTQQGLRIVVKREKR